MNPKVDEQGNVSGTNLNGEVAVSYSNDYIANQEKLHNALVQKDSGTANQKKDSTQQSGSLDSKKQTSSPSPTSGSSTKSNSGSTTKSNSDSTNKSSESAKKSSSSTKKSSGSTKNNTGGGGGIQYSGDDIPLPGGGHVVTKEEDAKADPGVGSTCKPGETGLGGLH